MKGKIVLIPVKEPKEGMKVVHGDNELNPRIIDEIWDVKPDFVVLKKRCLAPTLLSELQQIAVRYMEQGTDEGHKAQYVKELSLHPEDWKYALEHIEEEVEFKESTLHGYEAIKTHAKLIRNQSFGMDSQTATTTGSAEFPHSNPKMYSEEGISFEERVLKIVKGALVRGQQFDLAGIFRDEEKWWQEHNKKK